MRKINLLFFGLLLVTTSLTFTQVDAVPSDLRVITIDPEASGFGSSLVLSTNPSTAPPTTISLNDAGTLNFGEDIATYGGDVYVTNFVAETDVGRISRINLDVTGVGTGVEHITDEIFGALTGIAINSAGTIYVADSSDNQIYTVLATTTDQNTKSLLVTNATFAFIRAIALENNNLFVLDADFGGDNGRIFRIDLTPTQDGFSAYLIYSGDAGPFSLDESHNITVNNGIIYVSGMLNFIPGIIKIDSNLTIPTATIFLSGLPLSQPNGLAVDDTENDLYVANDNFVDGELPTIYRINMDSLTPTLVTDDDRLEGPTGITLLTNVAPSIPVDLEVSKEVNNPTPLPDEHIIYTITVKNIGTVAANSLLIHDDFPVFPPGTVNPFIDPQTNTLSYTSTIYDSAGGSTEGGTCSFFVNLIAVECKEFGSLNPGDYVVVTIEGVVEKGAQGNMTNNVLATNDNFSKQASVEISVNPSVEFSTLEKTANMLPPIVAGESTIEYEIIIDNSAPSTANAQNVVVTDSLPKGVTIDVDTIPAECQVIENLDGSSQLQCSYLLINNGNSKTISYTISVDSDATDPLENTVTVTCDNCAPGQSASTSTEVLRQSDLSIVKTSDKTEVIAGQDSIQYTISVTNNGPSDADNVVITDSLPNGVTLSVIGTSPECPDSQSNVVICNIASISSGQTHNIIINVDVNSNAVGPLENTASVTSESTETNTGDNEASSIPIDDVISLADMTVTKTGPDTTVAGRIITYDLTVTNIGSSDAANVSIQDELPTGFTFIQSTEPNSLTDPSCQLNLGVVVCDFGNIGPTETQTKSIQARIGLNAFGNIANTAEVFTDTEESDTDNNTSSIITIVEPPFCGRAESDFDQVITGTAGNDHIKGTNHDDLIFGLGGNDKIQGKDGNDCIIGGDGDDKLWGGAGDDGIEGNAGSDYIHGQQGNDTLLGGDGDDKIWGGKGNDIIDAGAGHDRVHGNQDNDNITGGDGNDWLGAGIGNDVVNGGADNDKIFGRPGNDILNGDTGDDMIHGGQGDDNVNGGDNNDKIYGHQGHDILNGNNGDDYIHGGQGNDGIDGGDGSDRCNGAQGTNTIVNCEIEDKKMKEEHEEDDNDEGESEPEDDDKKGKKNK